MLKIYRSKIGYFMYTSLFIILVFLVVIIFTKIKSNIHFSQIILPLTISIFILIIISIIMFNTTYTIKDNMLCIECIFFVYQNIDINKITRICETNNPLSAPAASLDRLKIFYGKNLVAIISPKEKKEFISDLISINSNIKFTENKHSSNIFNLL